MGIFSKKEVNLEEDRDIADDVVESDFIPYACHYNPNTILTKNGELLQTIKIVGFAYEHLSSEDLSLRETLRKAIFDHVDSSKFALWIHTIRRKTDLSPPGEYPDTFSKTLDEKWKQKNDWGNKFTNELYVTVVIDADDIPLFNAKGFVRGVADSVGLRFDRRYHHRSLSNLFEKLDSVVSGMLTVLEPFGAKRLGVYEKNEIFYSELLGFLGKIINLKEVEMPLPEIDLSRYLPQQDVTFGYNAMEVRGHDGRRRFGAMITVKEYKELSLNSIDYFLQIPLEFVISQSITFLNREKVLEQYEYQRFLMQASGDSELAKMSGLDDIVNNNRNSPVDYGEHQLCVFLLSDDLKHLERFTGKAIHVLSSLGIIGIREDIKFEECYWGLLPANFEFLIRLKPINTGRIGGFANLSNFPAGKMTGNRWGSAISVMYTAAKTPYFFNFHVDDCGHTTIIGRPGTGKTVLINFLLAQSQKLNSKIFFFDQNSASRQFIEKMGGNYFSCLGASQPGSAESLKLNPFSLPTTSDNDNFLYYWLLSMTHDLSTPPDSGTENALKACIKHIRSLQESERHLGAVKEFLQQHKPELVSNLSPWLAGGKYSHIFEGSAENADFTKRIIGVNLSEIQSDNLHIPVIYYLLHRINYVLGDSPAIIVVDEAWSVLDNPLLGSSVGLWLDLLTAKNAIALLASSDISSVVKSKVSEKIKTKIASQIFLPDSSPDEVYRNSFGLTEKEVMFLGMMEVEERHFLLKRGNDSIVVELNLDGLDDELAVLSKTSSAPAGISPIATELPKDETVLPIFGTPPLTNGA